MPPDPDGLDDLGTASWPARGTLMETAGGARGLAVADTSVVVGSAYWRHPARPRTKDLVDLGITADSLTRSRR
jgi:hypothetical protein